MELVYIFLTSCTWSVHQFCICFHLDSFIFNRLINKDLAYPDRGYLFLELKASAPANLKSDKVLLHQAVWPRNIDIKLNEEMNWNHPTAALNGEPGEINTARLVGNYWIKRLSAHFLGGEQLSTWSWLGLHQQYPTVQVLKIHPFNGPPREGNLTFRVGGDISSRNHEAVGLPYTW